MTCHFAGTLFEVWIKGLYGISSDTALFVDYAKIRKKIVQLFLEKLSKKLFLIKEHLLLEQQPFNVLFKYRKIYLKSWLVA
jgi:hypothetical protein